jgi:hypothetical protein
VVNIIHCEGNKARYAHCDLRLAFNSQGGGEMQTVDMKLTVASG